MVRRGAATLRREELLQVATVLQAALRQVVTAALRAAAILRVAAVILQVAATHPAEAHLQADSVLRAPHLQEASVRRAAATARRRQDSVRRDRLRASDLRE